MEWRESSDDLSYLDLLHKANDSMAKRAVELQRHYEQIIAETSDADKRAFAAQQLKRLKHMENTIPKTL